MPLLVIVVALGVVGAIVLISEWFLVRPRKPIVARVGVELYGIRRRLEASLAKAEIRDEARSLERQLVDELRTRRIADE